MKEITLALTERQENFLKEFAEKQYDGAKDNVFTETPIHTVQSKVERYIPYHEDLMDYFGGEKIKYSACDSYEIWFESLEDLIMDFFEDEPPIPYVSYEAVEHGTMIDVMGQEQEICSEKDYLAAYGITMTGKTWIIDEWKDVAWFFIRDEAKRYIEYQRHNLHAPRVYTHSLGYSNRGDMPEFREMLLTIGQSLNKEEQATA